MTLFWDAANETFEKVASFGVAANLTTYSIIFATLNFTSLLAYQLDQTDKRNRAGLYSYYNWYYSTSTASLVLSMTVLYIQTLSWALGFGIPTSRPTSAGARLCPCPHDINQQVLMLYSPPTRGNRIFRLPLYNLGEICITLPLYMSNGMQRYKRFLNKGEIMRDGDINDEGSARNSWEICSIQQIEDVKCLVIILPICFSGILSFTMDCHLGPHFQIPAGSVISISLITLAVKIHWAGRWNYTSTIETRCYSQSKLFVYCTELLVNITRKVTARYGHTSGLTDNINNGKLDFYYHYIAILDWDYYKYKVMSLHAEESIKSHAKEEAT
ncbi:hypothetical protein BDA96_03G430500 [Sorghum bicolor]|uniref:Uncharacterized protein n=1 Tax=Sorghum bicolor TaxID=4558 RepID=A0A921UQB5_SORBI|nr:hypothetical protein BDA96_03G430500 [Sorghum bicolor]